jgi:hypothetical protein
MKMMYYLIYNVILLFLKPVIYVYWFSAQSETLPTSFTDTQTTAPSKPTYHTFPDPNLAATTITGQHTVTKQINCLHPHARSAVPLPSTERVAEPQLSCDVMLSNKEFFDFQKPFTWRYASDSKISVITNWRNGTGSVVGIANAYGLNGPRIESRWRRDFPHLSRPALRPIRPPVQWVPGLSRE